MGFRTAWTNNVAKHEQVISVSPNAGEILVAFFVNDAVGDNFNWPPGWTNTQRITNTTNSQDLFSGTYGPCTGRETGWQFTDDSGVSNLIGGIAAFVQNTITYLDVAVVTAQTDSNQASPWTQDAAITPTNDGCTLVYIMGHDIIPPGVDHNIVLTATNTPGSLTWTNRANLDSAFANPDQGFEHIGMVTAFQATAGATTITGTGTSTPATSASRAVIVFALRRGTNITANPTNQVVQEGQTATFSVTALTRSGTLSYQWQNNTGSGWNDIGGATSTSYTTGTLVASTDNNTGIRVKVADDEGTVTSDSVVLTVLAVGKPWTYTA